MKRTHWETIRALAALLRVATDNGTLGALEGFMHPDAIVRFRDGITDMAGFCSEDELNED